MPAEKKPHPNLVAVAVSGIIAVSGLLAAGCNDNGSQPAPGAIGAASVSASPTPSSLASATPTPSPVKVVAVSPKPSVMVKPPAPKTSTKPPAPKPSPTHTHSGTVVPGAYCPDSEHGWYGRSAAGNLYRCSYYSSDGRWHWKRV